MLNDDKDLLSDERREAEELGDTGRDVANSDNQRNTKDIEFENIEDYNTMREKEYDDEDNNGNEEENPEDDPEQEVVSERIGNG